MSDLKAAERLAQFVMEFNDIFQSRLAVKKGKKFRGPPPDWLFCVGLAMLRKGWIFRRVTKKTKPKSEDRN